MSSSARHGHASAAGDDTKDDAGGKGKGKQRKESISIALPGELDDDTAAKITADCQALVDARVASHVKGIGRRQERAEKAAAAKAAQPANT